MQLHSKLVIVFCLTTILIHAQTLSMPSGVNIGDPAPLLRVSSWIKGTPVNVFEKGKVYVVEFWATWCRPCIAEMPHLSALARKYKNNVTIIGIDIYEEKTTTVTRIKNFVDSMGQMMDYNVAVAKSDSTENDWLIATGEINMGIPRVFIIDREGRLAWMGHPCNNFEEVLYRIVSKTWNINEALGKRNFGFHLRILDDSLAEVLKFAPGGDRRSDKWRQDSALTLIEEMARTEPLIKYTPQITAQIFSILLKTNTKKAYEYGKKVLETTTYEEPAAFIIKGVIEDLSSTINFPPEIYQLGIDAILKDIDFSLSCYPELKNFYKRYYRMAEWYWCIGNQSMAIETLEQAIQIIAKDDYLEKELAKCKSLLKQYKKT